MKKTYIIISLFIIFFSFAQTPKKVLFVGNSMTYFNDMPMLFESIANEKGKNVDVDFYAPGGTGFVNHHQDNNVYNLFKDNVWDIVVLQPGTAESAGVSWPVTTTALRGNKMQDSIKKYSPCAKVYLYEIPYGVPSETNYDNYFQIQTKIKDSITKLADLMHVPLVAAGECARQHYLAQQDLLLHSSYNDVHPNLNGSYLVANAMFCAIFQETISGVVYNGGVTPQNAAYFQGIADDIILNNKPQWRINSFNLHAEFSLNVLVNTASFSNLSTNYTSLNWDFGDGISSNEINPVHTYTTLGPKTITLTATRNGCSEIFLKNIDITILGLNEFNMQKIQVFPTYTNSFVTVKSASNIRISLLNSLGQKINSFDINNNELNINMESLESGMYFIVYESQVYKIIKH